MSGCGLEKPDSKTAFQWFKAAAKQGHVLGQSNVGAMCTCVVFGRARASSRRCAPLLTRGPVQT